MYGFNQPAIDIVFHRFHLVLYLLPNHLAIVALLNSVPQMNNIERDRVYVLAYTCQVEQPAIRR
jgi:hypothetical protein